MYASQSKNVFELMDVGTPADEVEVPPPPADGSDDMLLEARQRRPDGQIAVYRVTREPKVKVTSKFVRYLLIGRQSSVQPGTIACVAAGVVEEVN